MSDVEPMDHSRLLQPEPFHISVLGLPARKQKLSYIKDYQYIRTNNVSTFCSGGSGEIDDETHAGSGEGHEELWIDSSSRVGRALPSAQAKLSNHGTNRVVSKAGLQPTHASGGR